MTTTDMEALAAREVRCRIPGMEAVAVERGLVYATRDDAALTFDLYRPAGVSTSDLMPTVVVVAGFPDLSVRRIFGRPFKETGAVTSWCRLLAASGIAAVAYENRVPDEDLRSLLGMLAAVGSRHGIDAGRLGLFATSGHGPLALGTVMAAPEDAGRAPEMSIRCLSLAYPYTLDLDGTTAVAEAARAWGFANAAAGRTVAELPADLALLLVRAGGDQFAGLNAALERLVLAGLRRNLPLECLNLPDAPHAFDLEQEGPAAHRALRRILAFFREHLASGGRG